MPEEVKKGSAVWKRIIQEEERLAREFESRTIGYILAALGLVAGLAWNEAIKALITWLFPGTTSDIVAKFIYAFVVTMIAVLISFYLARLLKDINNQESKK